MSFIKKGRGVKQYHFLFILLVYVSNICALNIDKVVIWGHFLHTHTHSYIHAAFDKTFRHLGYQTLWLNNQSDISSIDFKNTLFITEGQVDQNIPLRNDCWYIIHNCDTSKYKDLIDQKRCIILQVYTHDIRTRNVHQLEPYIYYDKEEKTIYMPWATDLLPHEIEQIQKNMVWDKKKYAVFIGSLIGGYFGNISQLQAFEKRSIQHHIPFIQKTIVDSDEAISLIQNALFAPAIQGNWQIEKGYIPCRIFKNISYGAYGITNSKTVWELFDKKIAYDADDDRLWDVSCAHVEQSTKADLLALMDFVKEKHTYKNRIHHLLTFFEIVQE